MMLCSVLFCSVVAPLCGVCTQFDSLVHFCTHTSIAEQCNYCPLCLIALLHLTLNEHFAQAHEVNCCGEVFCFFDFFRSNLRYPALNNFYQDTVQCRPRLLWEKIHRSCCFLKSQIMACHQCIVKRLKDSWEA